MKINIISFHNHHSLSADVEVIAYCLRKFYKNKSYTDKVYNKAIDDMIKDKDR